MRTLLFISFFIFSLSVIAQDHIKLYTGEIIKGRVTRIEGGRVFYKKMHKLKDKDIFIPKSDVMYIKYASGKVVSMEAKTKAKKTVKKKAVVKKKK